MICTYTNTKSGTVTIVKDARYPPAEEDPQDFVFSYWPERRLCPRRRQHQHAVTARSITFTNVAPNPLPAPSYDCTETQVPGWLMTIGCTEDGVSNSTAQAPTAKIRVDPGENVICTQQHVQPGRLSRGWHYGSP